MLLQGPDAANERNGSAKSKKKKDLQVNKRLNITQKGSLSPNATRRIGNSNRSLVARAGSPQVASSKAAGYPLTNSILANQNNNYTKTPKPDFKMKKQGTLEPLQRNQNVPHISKLSDDSAPSTENSRSDCDASDDDEDLPMAQLGPAKAADNYSKSILSGM